MSSSILQKIGANTRARLAQEKTTCTLENLKQKFSASPQRKPHPFKSALEKPGPQIIAEYKRASPSQGAIAPHLRPLDVAGAYLRSGAAALSILTEPDFFQGSLQFLSQIRNAFPNAALLMKDFIVDPYQLYQGRLAGADAVLLIVDLLADHDLKMLYDTALSLDLTPLVEVHNAEEMARASALGADLIGVNNRNLNTLEIDLNTSKTLQSLAPSDATLVCESGLTSGLEIGRAQSWGYQGFLIGTHLMASGDPGQALKTLLEEVYAH